MHVVCAWCGRELEGGEPAAHQGDPPRVSHGVCSDCASILLGGDSDGDGDGVPISEFLSGLQVPVLLVSDDLEALEINEAGTVMLGKSEEAVLGRLGGEIFDCTHSRLEGGCGRTVHCSGCVLRSTVEETHRTGQPAVRVPATLKVGDPDGLENAVLHITTAKVGGRVLLHVDAGGRLEGRREPDPDDGGEREPSG